MRGLDYYTRTSVRIRQRRARRSVGRRAAAAVTTASWSRSAALRTHACGWAAGVERILLAGGEQPVAANTVDLFVALANRDTASSTAAFELARTARRAGLAAQLELSDRSLKGQLKHADRLSARYVAIVNDGGEQTSFETWAAVSSGSSRSGQ